MIFKLSMSNRSGQVTANPSWQEIETSLSDVWAHSSCVTISVTDEPAIDPHHLQVRADRQRAIVTLGVMSETDYEVRSYSSGRDASHKVDILGDEWSDAIVCRQYDVVVAVFKEFFDTGEVSKELLN